MPRSTLALVGLTAALVLALLTSLVDWMLALSLLAALVAGWAGVVAFALARPLYQRHRPYVLGALGVIVLALLIVLRPDGSGSDDAEGDSALEVTSWDGELWPRRIATEPSFILRERHATSEGAVAIGATGATLPVRRGGLLAHEIRFAPGTSTGSAPLELARDGSATLVVNPIEGGSFLQAPRGDATRVDLPDGEVVRVGFGRLPATLRMTYVTGPGRMLRPLMAPALPLRSLPLPLVLFLFTAVGVAAALGMPRLLVDPVRRRVERKPQPPRAPRAPGSPPGPIERAPLVPRRK